MARIVALLSGGLDSTVLVAYLLDRGHQVDALSADYGQRHRRELEAAGAVAAHYGLQHDLLDMTAVGSLLSGSALTDHSVAVPDGHYAAEQMRTTIVPNRNMLFLAAAGGIAQAREAHAIAIAVHAGDHYIYPDCRPPFLAAMREALRLATEEPERFGLGILSPFEDRTKADIVTLGAALGAPMGLSWSCYRGGLSHCGKCGTCYERREAFALAGVADPTDYVDQLTIFADPTVPA